MVVLPLLPRPLFATSPLPITALLLQPPQPLFFCLWPPCGIAAHPRLGWCCVGKRGAGAPPGPPSELCAAVWPKRPGKIALAGPWPDIHPQLTHSQHTVNTQLTHG